MRGLGILVLVVVACDRGSAPTAAECKSTAEAMVKAVQADAKAVNELAGDCAKASWSADARSCLAKAGSRTAIRECSYKYLTHEQEDAISDALSNAREALAAMERFKERMCRCTNSSCAGQVSDEMARWGQEQARVQKEPPELSKTEQKQAVTIGEEMGVCMQHAMSGGSGGAM